MVDILINEKEKATIRVRNVTVSYRAYKERPTSLKESVIKFIRHGKLIHYDTFNALSEVTFDVRKGSVFGIIGSNGSGKSTLLKVISKVLEPTYGSTQINGSISSLIELGAGFDPNLNAYENIFLNGSLHKKTKKEIERRVDSILDFAELREFASTPIKYYSSGMYARLGFSVAIDIDPDVLLVDEILAVGDERFQEKCHQAMDKFVKRGKTIVIVTHNLGMIAERSDSVLLLARGKVSFVGDPITAVDLYRNSNYETRL